jgi:AcrR family transcriptional regulator
VANPDEVVAMVRQARADETRRVILDAAAAEFDEAGFDAARLDKIIARTSLSKGAVYFHFSSKLDLARELVAAKYINWPVVVAEVTGGGLRGIDAATAITRRVGQYFVADVRVRAAMRLSQTVLPPAVDENPYDQWIDLIAVFVQQGIDDGDLNPATDAADVATVAVQAFFGAYMIDHELGRLENLSPDVERLWKLIAANVSAELETAVLVWNQPGERDLFPSLITSVSMHKPGELVGHGAKLVASHKRLGFNSRFLVLCDRAYNGGSVDTFHIPVRLMGAELVCDYKKTELGEQSAFVEADIILVDGAWYVKWMPQKLRDVTKEYRLAVESLTKRVDRRALSKESGPR